MKNKPEIHNYWHPSSKQILIGAHRGGGSLGPENILCTAIRGYLAGADFWELDVQLTADEHLVVAHDDDLKRTSNARTIFPDCAPWVLCDFTWAEIRQLDFGSWLLETDPFAQLAQGSIGPDLAATFIGQPAPSLLEALLLTQALSWHVNVEIKDHSQYRADTHMVDSVVSLIQTLGMPDRVLISSFNHHYLERVKEIDAAIATGVLVEEMPGDPVTLTRTLNAQAFHPPVSAVTGELIEALQEAGISVNAWTVNDPAEIKALIQTGVRGIITDFPQLLEPVRQDLP